MSKSESGSNPEYVNARVKSRRAKLFHEDDYRKLIRMGPGEIARYMEETEYETEMDSLGSRYSGVDLIEYALNENLAKHFNDLLRWASGRLYEMVARYLRKFDAWNVKTILRGFYADTSREEIEADLIAAGEFDERFLTDLLDAGSIDAVVERLQHTIYGDPLEAGLDDYDETGLLVPLENAVDRAFYENLLADLDAMQADDATRMYVEFLQAEIDFRNARNALRLARTGAGLDPADYYIEGGRLFEASELQQLVNNRDELLNRIRDSVYGDRLSDALDELEAAESLIGFERALEAALLEYGDRMSHVYPLSISPVLAYVLAKEREVDNIRAIARGREAGLSEEEIETELVML